MTTPADDERRRAEFQALAKAECAVEGHDFEDLMVMESRVPIARICGRCGLRENLTGDADA